MTVDIITERVHIEQKMTGKYNSKIKCILSIIIIRSIRDRSPISRPSRDIAREPDQHRISTTRGPDKSGPGSRSSHRSRPSQNERRYGPSAVSRKMDPQELERRRKAMMSSAK